MGRSRNHGHSGGLARKGKGQTPISYPGATVSSGAAGADGWIRGIPVVTTVYRQTSTDARQITQDDRGPFTVEATYGAGTTSQDVQIAASLALTLTLS